MRNAVSVLLCVVVLGLAISGQVGSDKKVEIVPRRGYEAPKFQASPELQSLLNSAIDEMIKSYGADKFKPEEVAATLIDLRDPNNMGWASYSGGKAIYPASVVKMFYMAALHQQLEDKKASITPELTRGLHDMIVDSSNEATQYILDVLTDTSSGAELPQSIFEKWQYKRNRVNRYFSAMGYTGINVNQKTFCEDAYGIEQQSRKYKGQNRNMLTTDATARLLTEIVLGRAVTPERSRQMMELMAREPFKESKDPDNQATGFTGKALIDKKLTGTKLWSKAGWTSKSRHDAAYVETPDGLKFVLVVFTENHATDREPVPTIAGTIIDRMPRK
ncbi:MAG TPA: serine hydrolase [Pyrinomonadaceae bacterium]|nr:serine hydrolase [Pyrinomonadaceae bacterium]